MRRMATNGRGPSFWIKVAVAVVLVGIADILFFQQSLYGGAFGLFEGALLIGMLMGHSGCRRDGRAWLAAGLALIFAAAMVVDANPLALLLFVIAISMTALLPQTGRFDDGWRWFQRLFVHVALSPFRPLVDVLKLRRVRRQRLHRGGTARRNWCVLLLPFFGTSVFLFLFAAANPVLAQWLNSIQLPVISLALVGRIILWALVLIVAWSLLRPKVARRLFGTFDGSGDVHLPGVSLTSVTLSLVAFNAIFALQNGMDIAYLWGLLPMPAGMTLASYAHQGAYPLIVTALLAGLFVLVTLRPGSSTAQSPRVRQMVVLWIGQNLFLVSSSILRTLDYVGAYSLTRLRIAALVWMALVMVGLLLICWRMLRGKSASWLINGNLVAAGFVLSACSFVDLGAIAAHWNVKHAREVGGHGAKLDLCYLNSLGSSALLSLVELEQRPLTPAMQDRVHFVRAGIQAQVANRVANGGWTWLDGWRVAQLQPLFGLDRVLDDHRDCTGQRYDLNREVGLVDQVLAQIADHPPAPPLATTKPHELTRGQQR